MKAKIDVPKLITYRPLVILLSESTAKGRKRLHAAINLKAEVGSNVVFEVSVGEGGPTCYNNLTEAINAYKEI